MGRRKGVNTMTQALTNNRTSNEPRVSARGFAVPETVMHQQPKENDMDEIKVEHVEHPEGREFERSVNLRLDELDRKIERLLTLVCPVCGPDLVKQIHPEKETDGG